MDSTHVRMHNARLKTGKISNQRSGDVTVCSSGFTLFELLLILFIISLFISLAMPSLSVLGERRIKSDAKRLASIVRYLHDSSLTGKEIYSLTMDFEEKVLRYTGPEGEKRETFKTVVSAELMTKGFVSEGELTIYFRPTGGSEVFRILLDDDKTSYMISFNPFSGRAKITQNET
ncbi:MAG: hypothetical protein JSV13_10660 [Nitrospiraceae bacterium]|nr:MAG: hypothetical protein JSV13_10660 [Nitrospiraceae bacterium]